MNAAGQHVGRARLEDDPPLREEPLGQSAHERVLPTRVADQKHGARRLALQRRLDLRDALLDPRELKTCPPPPPPARLPHAPDRLQNSTAPRSPRQRSTPRTSAEPAAEFDEQAPQRGQLLVFRARAVASATNASAVTRSPRRARRGELAQRTQGHVVLPSRFTRASTEATTGRAACLATARSA